MNRKSKPNHTMKGSELDLAEGSPVRGDVEALEFVAGRVKGEDAANVTGCVLETDVVLVQTYPADNYGLYARFGGSWYLLSTVGRDHPAILAAEEAGRMKHAGPTAAEERKEREKADAAARRLEREDAEKQRRKNIWERIMRQSREREERGKAERRERLGIS